MKRLGCRWVGTCASSSDASPLYIHDRSNVVQWKGSSLPSSQCTSSDQCIFGKMCSDESENRDFSSWHVIRIRIGPGYVRLIFMVINFVDIYIYIYMHTSFFPFHVGWIMNVRRRFVFFTSSRKKNRYGSQSSNVSRKRQKAEIKRRIVDLFL